MKDRRPDSPLTGFRAVLIGTIMLVACITLALGDVRALPPSPKDPARVGVIIVLGSGHIYEAKPGFKMVQRVGSAVAAYREKRAKYLLFCGGHTTGHIAEADEMKIMAQAYGIPSRAILTENGSISTNQNARHAERIIDKKKFRSALLVTHSNHLPRAVAAYKKIKRLKRIHRWPADDFAPKPIELEFDQPLPPTGDFQAIVIHGRSRSVDFMGDTLVLDSLQKSLATAMAYLYQQGATDIPYFVWHKAIAIGHVTRAEMIGIAAAGLGLPARHLVYSPSRRFSHQPTGLFEFCTEQGWTKVLALTTPGREDEAELIEEQYRDKGIEATVITAPEVKD
jgi:hypothetical protein